MSKQKWLTEKQKYKVANKTGIPVEEICKQFGISKSTYYKIRQDYGMSAARIREYSKIRTDYYRLLERIKKLEEELSVLHEAGIDLSAPRKVRLEAASKLYPKYNVHVLCSSLNLNRATFYNYIYRAKKDKSWFNVRRANLTPLVQQIYDESHQIYGADKIGAVLRSRGKTVSNKFVASIMKDLGLTSIRTDKPYKKMVRMTENRINLLKRHFKVSAPDRVWVADFTDLPFKNERLVFCAFIDLYSRKVIAYDFSKNKDQRLAIKILRDAYETRKNPERVIIHTDQGFPFTSDLFIEEVAKHLGKQSFSEPGHPHDNAVAESFFASLKREEVYRKDYDSLSAMKESIKKYILFYNEKRIHKFLKNRTPKEVEEAYRAR